MNERAVLSRDFGSVAASTLEDGLRADLAAHGDFHAMLMVEIGPARTKVSHENIYIEFQTYRHRCA